MTSPSASASSARDAPAAHDDVLGAAEPDEPREPLRAAPARDHPERHLGQAELDVVGGDAEVAGQRELEADAEARSPRSAAITGFGQRSGAATF